MKIAERVYQTSGNMFGTNSNTYCLDTKEGLVLVDAGFSEKQYQIMQEQRMSDGNDRKKITDVFITHGHFDHAGNGWLLQKAGGRICMSEEDADAVSKADERVLSELFGRKFRSFTPNVQVKDGQQFHYGNAHLTVLEHPGHTEGTISLLAEISGKRILFTGDLFILKPCTPLDELQIEAGWNGGPDYDAKKNMETLRKLCELPPVDLVAPGHGSIYFGDSRKLFELLYQVAEGK